MSSRKQRWTREKIIEIAKNYHTKHEFLTKEPKAYDAAVRNNMLSEFTWLEGRGELTYEAVVNKARKYKTLNDFRKEEGSAYNKATKEGWISEFGWLIRSRVVHWDYNEVRLEATKYNTAKEFKNKSALQYNAAAKHRWLSSFTWLEDINPDYSSVEEVSKKYSSLNMFKTKQRRLYKIAEKNGWIKNFTWLKKRPRYPSGYWTYDRVKELASSCRTKNELKKKSRSAYQKARSNGWLDDFDWLIDNRFDLYSDPIDMVYAYEFTQSNAVYVGRTLIVRQAKRDEEHRTKENDSVYTFAKVNDLQVPSMTILESGLLLKDGVEKEGIWVEVYRSKGWNIINKVKTGSIGSLSRGKWSYETVKQEARKYKTFSEFSKNNRTAYVKAKNMGWIKEFTWLTREYNFPGYWNYNRVRDEAKKFHLRSEFKHSSGAAYEVARKNKWLDEFFPKQK